MKNRLFLFSIVPTIILFGIYGYHFLTGLPPLLMMSLAIIVGVAVQLLFYLFFKLLRILFKNFKSSYVLVGLSGLASLIALKMYGFGWPDIIYYPISILAILVMLLLHAFFQKKTVWIGLFLIMSIIGFGVMFFLLADMGDDPYTKEVSTMALGKDQISLEAQGVENPTTPGSFKVKTFTYGSGTDIKRPEYAEGVKFITPTVDATNLLPDWKGKKKRWREQFWGFGVDKLPLNGRVYMPEGKGPFPLAIVVHGNHSMIDYSDDGYGYLGSLLASRGIITVSVDENFVNGHWSGDFRGKEMPVRAWLLLKHIEQWQTWNNDAEHELANKVDTDNIMLMGHSRGGEAVTIAGAYNILPYLPDTAKEKFDFNFNIKGIVSIAPTDYRYDRKIVLKNINYLSLQGSYDSDEVSFWGMRPYRRLQYTDSINRFKAGVYVHHANHGQFNSTWGNSDFGAPSKWLLNLEPLLSEEEQQEVAKVFISAFAEATLKGNNSYLPIFKNVAYGQDWLPNEYFLTNYASSKFKPIVNFEEDINITTAPDSIVIAAKNMNLWKEQPLTTRDGGKQDNTAVVLGWNYKEKEGLEKDSLAVYEIIGNKELWKNDSLQLQMTVGAGDLTWLNNVKGTENIKDPIQLDFTIVLTDIDENTASIKVSDVKRITNPLKSKFTKFNFLDKSMIGSAWEVQLQTFHFPLYNFTEKENEFDAAKVSKISLVFDQTNMGVIVLDDIGVSN
ncbi:alpha/beta hydrolase [Maribacter thermophilus]|uniref:alpha/beta hydrolase n=1 Tax=Maribacter thermophilus TaxID=1197874 RepID=UPI00069B75BC|nr:alpha/beta hydrolase [Maribacter thermophilus]